MNKENENNNISINISPIESEHLDKYRKLSDREKEFFKAVSRDMENDIATDIVEKLEKYVK